MSDDDAGKPSALDNFFGDRATERSGDINEALAKEAVLSCTNEQLPGSDTTSISNSRSEQIIHQYNGIDTTLIRLRSAVATGDVVIMISARGDGDTALELSDGIGDGVVDTASPVAGGRNRAHSGSSGLKGEEEEEGEEEEKEERVATHLSAPVDVAVAAKARMLSFCTIEARFAKASQRAQSARADANAAAVRARKAVDDVGSWPRVSFFTPYCCPHAQAFAL